jgi:hypothetical protein
MGEEERERERERRCKPFGHGGFRGQKKMRFRVARRFLRWVLGMETRRGRLAISGCPALATDHWSCRVLRDLQKNRDRE